MDRFIRILIVSNTNSWYNLYNARTCVGLTQDNKTLVLFTVDNAGGSNGMTVGDVANYMSTISPANVYNALNLDGGGRRPWPCRTP